MTPWIAPNWASGPQNQPRPKVAVSVRAGTGGIQGRDFDIRGVPERFAWQRVPFLMAYIAHGLGWSGGGNLVRRRGL